MPTEREKQAEQAVLNGLVLINGGNNNTAGDNTNTCLLYTSEIKFNLHLKIYQIFY